MCSPEGSVYEHADLLVYKPGSRFAVRLLGYCVSLLREVKKNLAHCLVHSKLYNLKYRQKICAFISWKNLVCYYK